jgi:hypothetical protein
MWLLMLCMVLVTLFPAWIGVVAWQSNDPMVAVGFWVMSVLFAGLFTVRSLF